MWIFRAFATIFNQSSKDLNIEKFGACLPFFRYNRFHRTITGSGIKESYV